MLVAGTGLPPEAATCWSGPALGENRITPLELQLPPRAEGDSHNATGRPPATSMRLILPAAKKPSDWLSGDQNGYRASFVPGNSFPLRETSGRIQRLSTPPAVTTNAMSRPSGEITPALPPNKAPPLSARKAPPAGGFTEKRRVRAALVSFRSRGAIQTSPRPIAAR